MEKEAIPIWQKYTLTIKEASAYFNICESKLRRIISENQSADFILMNSTKILIKRRAFEKMIDSITSI